MSLEQLLNLGLFVLFVVILFYPLFGVMFDDEYIMKKYVDDIIYWGEFYHSTAHKVGNIIIVNLRETHRRVYVRVGHTVVYTNEGWNPSVSEDNRKAIRKEIKKYRNSLKKKRISEYDEENKEINKYLKKQLDK